LKNVDETHRKNVEPNVFSRKMLIQLFSEKCWLKNVGSTFSLKNVTTFSKNVETFSNARVGEKKEGCLDGIWWARSSHCYPPSGR
jgi:hypothetical protein